MQNPQYLISPPTYTNGEDTRFQTDSAGNLQVALNGSGTEGLATAAKQDTGNTSLASINTATGAKTDAAATDSTSSWSVISVLKGLWAQLALILTQVTTTATNTGASATAANQTNGAQKTQVTIPGTATRLQFTTGATDITDATSHAIFAAPAGGLRNYMYYLWISNTSSTGTRVWILDGSTKVMSLGIGPNYGGGSIPLPIAYQQPALAAALNIQAETAGAALQVNAFGWSGA
jgi:hypothetical protein